MPRGSGEASLSGPFRRMPRRCRRGRLEHLDQVFLFHGHGVEEVTQELMGILLSVLSGVDREV